MPANTPPQWKSQNMEESDRRGRKKQNRRSQTADWNLIFTSSRWHSGYWGSWWRWWATARRRQDVLRELQWSPVLMTAYVFSTVLTSAVHIKSKGLNTVRGFFCSGGIPLLCTFATQNTELYSEIEYCTPWCKVLYALVGIKYPDIMLPCWIWNSSFPWGTCSF